MCSKRQKQERNYRCQRCLNHEKMVLRKSHVCEYKTCKCAKCNLNNERRQINRDIMQNRRKPGTIDKAKDDNNHAQHCTLCKNHGILIKLKGHKKSCPNKDCECKPCSDGKKHRQIMAQQTKIRRSQNQTTTNRVANKKTKTKRTNCDAIIKPIAVKPLPLQMQAPAPTATIPNLQEMTHPCCHVHDYRIPSTLPVCLCHQHIFAQIPHIPVGLRPFWTPLHPVPQLWPSFPTVSRIGYF